MSDCKELNKVNRGEYPYGEGQSWAEPSADEAVAAMRALVENAALASRIGRAARETMQNKFSMELIGGMIYERLFRARAELLPLPQIRIVD